MYIIEKLIILDCHCIKSKQINARWKYKHKGKKKEEAEKMIWGPFYKKTCS